jgi:uncharacterized protein
MKELTTANIPIESMVNKYLRLTILPTEQCNFRCVYCYEDFQNGIMSFENINAIKKLLDARAQELENLSISWFGGEPLVAKNIIVDISNYALELSKKYDFKFTSDITTNGYNLTEKTFDDLCKVGVNTYHISLDGPREIHNKTRILSNGEGTFDTIWNNLINIHNSTKNASVILRLHIDEDKIVHIEELINCIKKYFKGDDRFKVYLKSISRLGGKNDEKLKVVNKVSLDNLINNLDKLLSDEQIYTNNNSMCYASSPINWVIRSTGDICKCTVGLNDSKNTVGKLNLDGSLNIDNKKLQPWFKGIINEDTSILNCPYAYIIKEGL